MSEVSQPEVPSLDVLTNDVLSELGRRLRNEKDRKELPGSMLIKIASDLIRFREKEQNVKEEAEVRPLEEVLADAELPMERKRAIALEELERLQEAAEGLTAYLEVIDAGEEP